WERSSDMEMAGNRTTSEQPRTSKPRPSCGTNAESEGRRQTIQADKVPKEMSAQARLSRISNQQELTTTRQLAQHRSERGGLSLLTVPLSRKLVCTFFDNQDHSGERG